jgi:hypothetical protein
VSWPTELLPTLVAFGWLVRATLVSPEEGHEAITRAAMDGLELVREQQEALIRGVRAPDVSLAGFLASALPFAQRRHALRAWSGMTTQRGIHEMREFLAATHARALALPEGPRRWIALGEVLHCLQDSYSPAHADRLGAQILRMKHWGPLDALRRGRAGEPVDEHGFPSDRGDSVWSDEALTVEAQAAVAASRRYLELAAHHSGSHEGNLPGRRELDAFLDGCVREVGR